jgi:hypothetical protein
MTINVLPRLSHTHRIVASSLVIVCVPNLVFVALARYIALQRAWINIDYVIPGIVFIVCRQRWPFALSFAALLLLDLTLSVAPGFYLTPASVVRSVPLLAGLVSPYTLSLLALAVTGVGVLTMLALRLKATAPVSGRALVWVLLCFFGFSAGTLAIDRGKIFLALSYKVNVGTSTTKTFLTSLKSSYWDETRIITVESATTSWFEKLDRREALAENLVLVIMESWGSIRDASVSERYRSRLRQKLGDKYLVSFGETSFRGSTVPGELRELCGIEAITTAPQVSLFPPERCLPESLRAEGYETYAWHNYSGTFFNRLHWYEDIGFQHRTFQRHMLEATPTLRRCGGTFTGVCDEEIPEMLLRAIRAEPGRKFLYWLTVSSHFPVDPIPVGETARLCGFSPLLKADKYICALENRVWVTLDSLADALNRISDHDVEVIIVGDHAPGFLRPGANDRYSRRQVPTIHLRRQSGTRGLREGR